MNIKKKLNKQHNRKRNQETKPRESINSVIEEQSVKPQHSLLFIFNQQNFKFECFLISLSLEIDVWVFHFNPIFFS